MQLAAAAPCAPLARFVASIWRFRGSLPFGLERIVPSGAASLLVNLERDELRTYRGDRCERVERTRGAVLCGVHAQSFAIDTLEQRDVLGVTFHPGGAYPFFAAPAAATRDLHLELEALWGRDGASLRERLLEAGETRAMFRLLQKALLARAVRPLQYDALVSFALQELDRGVRVRALLEHSGVAPRTLLQRFEPVVGLTPKRFARVRRFRRLIDSLPAHDRPNWSALAQAHGYFDQAHLIGDFHEFAGSVPSDYSVRGPEAAGHLRLRR